MAFDVGRAFIIIIIVMVIFIDVNVIDVLVMMDIGGADGARGV